MQEEGAGKSTIDQIFTQRKILEKVNGNQFDTYHLQDEAAFNSPISNGVFAAVYELSIPAKLIASST